MIHECMDMAVCPVCGRGLAESIRIRDAETLERVTRERDAALARCETLRELADSAAHEAGLYARRTGEAQAARSKTWAALTAAQQEVVRLRAHVAKLASEYCGPDHGCAVERLRAGNNVLECEPPTDDNRITEEGLCAKAENELDKVRIAELEQALRGLMPILHSQTIGKRTAGQCAGQCSHRGHEPECEAARAALAAKDGP
jgi:hypothetical protein